MKRILTLILVLALTLSVFAGCDKIKDLLPGGDEQPPHEHSFTEGKCECGESDPNYVPHEHDFVEGKCECGESDPDYVPTPDVDADLQSAYDYIHQMYKTMKNTAGNYNLVKVVPVGSKNFTVTWSVNVDSITITENPENENEYTVNVPVLEFGDPAINYELTFVVANEAGETLTRTYSLVVPEFKPLTFDEYFEAEKGEPVVVEGIVTGISSKSSGDKDNCVFLQDLEGKGGYYIYALAEDPAGTYEVGMKVLAKGDKDIYNGTHEVKNATLVITDSTLNPVEPVDITELYKNAANTSDKSLTGIQGMLVTVKGVTVLDAGDNGYYNWILDGKKSYLRISSSTNCTTKAQETTIIANHSANFYNLADVTGIVTIYNNAFYLAPVTENAFSNFVEQVKPDDVQVSVEKGNLSIKSPIVVAGAITLPTAGTNFSEVTISWALAETANATLEGNVFTPILPTEGEVTVTLTATLTKGDVTDTKEFSVVIKALAPITIPEANELASGQSHNTYTADKYIVEGVITEITGAYGNAYIEDADGNKLYVYGIYTADGSTKYGDMTGEKPGVGDTVRLLGILGQYNGTLQMKSGWLLSWTKGEGGEVTPPAGGETTDCPFVAGTEYYFGYNNAGTMTYLDGTTVADKAFRWNLATDTAAAAKFVLETADGGFYVSFTIDGAKKYMNIVKSGNYTNLLADDTAISVWTWNSELKALVVDVDGTLYVPKAYNNYTTIEAKTIDYVNGDTYVLTCVVIGGSEGGEVTPPAGGEDGGETPVDPTPDPVTDKIELTVDSLGIANSTYAAGTPTINGVSFEFIQLGNYGSGIQMRDKDGNTSYLWNTSAIAGGIKEIRLVFSASKSTYDNTDAVIFTFGNSVKGASYTTKLTTKAGVKEYVITPDSDGYTYFYLEHDISYSFYWDSITIVLADGSTVDPDAPHIHTWVDATCTSPKKCAGCGETEGVALDHTYNSNGKCTCGAVDPDYVAPEAPASGTVSVTIADYADANGWSNSVLYDTIQLNSLITVTASGTPVGTYSLNTGKYYTSGENWRIYQNEKPSVTITAAEGKTIVSVKITYSVKNGGCLTNNGQNITSGTVVTVNGSSITFSVGNTGTATNGQAQITAIEVVYE